jgi:hypothetical protein
MPAAISRGCSPASIAPSNLVGSWTGRSAGVAPRRTATHVWTVAEVEEWLAERPAERPVPDAATPKRRLGGVGLDIGDAELAMVVEDQVNGDIAGRLGQPAGHISARSARATGPMRSTSASTAPGSNTSSMTSGPIRAR